MSVDKVIEDGELYWTALHRAARLNDVDKARQLLQGGGESQPQGASGRRAGGRSSRPLRLLASVPVLRGQNLSAVGRRYVESR